MPINVIAKHPRLSSFWKEHPDAEGPLLAWFKTTRKADWKNFGDLRETFAHADQVGHLTVFNIGGNKYRLIAEVKFDKGRVYVRHVLTHKEYDRGDWKESEPGSHHGQGQREGGRPRGHQRPLHRTDPALPPAPDRE